VARERGIPMTRGTYAAVLGPSYETPAEVRALGAAGAHAVGMSTVPEVTVARALGLRVLAFSLITNRAAGLGREPLNHQEVLEVGKAAGGRLQELIQGVMARLDRA
jgi:purine-nucleoside phosphorylase